MRSLSLFGKLCRRGRCDSIATFLLALLLAAATGLTGCEKQRELSPLTGKVLYRGKPLPFGSVIIEHKNGQPATGVIQSDGTFEMATRGEGKGVALGTCRVRIACYENGDPAKRSGPNPPNTLGRLLIPQKYTSFETSGLTVNVLPDANEPVVFDLR